MYKNHHILTELIVNKIYCYLECSNETILQRTVESGSFCNHNILLGAKKFQTSLCHNIVFIYVQKIQ